AGARLLFGADRDDLLVLILVLSLPQRTPGDGSWRFSQPLAKGFIVTMSPRHDGDEPSVAAGDVLEILLAGQLAIRHIQEVFAARKLAEHGPGVDVCGIVGDVAAMRGEINRNAAIIRDGERIKQLLQVWTFGLAMSVGDRRNRPPEIENPLLAVRIESVKGHGGGIVVQFVQLQLKLMDHLADHPEDHFLAGTLKHAFQTPPETIIVKLPDLVCKQVQ